MRLGSDPEVFLMQGNKHISSIGLIGAGKWNPAPMPGMAKGFTMQEDNVTVEFGIPPAASSDEFVAHIRDVQKRFLELEPTFTFSKLSCTIFDRDQMQDPLAHIFGCEPDFNAWTKKVNDKPEPPHPYMRSAGGHVHVESKANKYRLIQAMDLLLGVPSTLMDDGEDRKQLYGKMGAFRPKPYGAEYRVLSNYWIFDEKLIAWVWRASEKAETLAKSKFDLKPLETLISRAINNNDKAVAQHLVNEYQLETV
jgi:hypothetical protein